MMGAWSGTVPSRFDAPGNVTHLVRSSIRAITFSAGRMPVRVERCEHVLGTGPIARGAPGCDVGVVVEAGADDPVAGLHVSAIARVRANVIEVMFGPNVIPRGRR